MTLGQAMAQRFKLAEPDFQRWVAKSGRPVTCSEGCSACCELLALCTWPEALLVAQHLIDEKMVPTVAAALVEQALRCDYDGLDQRSYFERRIRCAFLTTEFRCAIYEARPAVCRYHVVYSDPRLCADRAPDAKTLHTDEGEAVRVIVMPLLHDIAKQAGDVAYELAPVPVMVLAALRELGQDVHVPFTPRQWLDRHGKRVYAAARQARAAAVPPP